MHPHNPTRWQEVYYHEEHWLERVDDNCWQLMRWVQIVTNYGLVAVYPEYLFDKDSVVRNSPDFMPSLIHDFLYDHRMYKGGKEATRLEADRIYTEMNQRSDCRFNRRRSGIRHRGIRLFGVWAWWWRPRLSKKVIRPKPLPTEHLHVYSNRDPDPSLGPIFLLIPA
jgi:hypothetical protein